jgi:hypothetical protein
MSSSLEQGGGQVVVQVDAGTHIFECLACKRRARYGIRRDLGVLMHYCADDVANRVQMYKRQGHEVVYTPAAQRALLADGKMVAVK